MDLKVTGCMQTGIIWLRIGSIGGLFLNILMNLLFQ